MLNQLDPREVHAVLQSLERLYVKEEKGYGDLSITLEHESDNNDGRTDTVTGFVVTLAAETVTLGVGTSDIEHVDLPLSRVTSITIKR
jgi:hypothetical protein